MGGSRRKYKRSRAKVQVGLPRKNPHIFKPAFNLPPKLKTLIDPSSKWDEKGSVIENYKSFGVVSNPNYLGVRSRTSHIVESDALQMPTADGDVAVSEFEPIDSGSELEEDGECFLRLLVDFLFRFYLVFPFVWCLIDELVVFARIVQLLDFCLMRLAIDLLFKASMRR